MAVAYTGNLGLTFQDLSTMIGQTGPLTVILRVRNVGRETALSLIDLIQSFIADRPLQQAYKIDLYEDALIEIGKFINTRKIKIQKSERGWYPESWYEEQTKMYHIVMLMVRNLGFDPLNFRALDEEIFAYGGQIGPDGSIINGYARHHFRITVDRFGYEYYDKKSLDTQDLILTDSRMHNSYHLISEQKMLEILEAFELLMNLKGSGPNGWITRQDIVDNLPRAVYQRWFRDPNFARQLELFNERRDYYGQNGLEAYINEYYETVHNRFFGDGYDIYTTMIRVPFDTHSGTDVYLDPARVLPSAQEERESNN